MVAMRYNIKKFGKVISHISPDKMSPGLAKELKSRGYRISSAYLDQHQVAVAGG